MSTINNFAESLEEIRSGRRTYPRPPKRAGYGATAASPRGPKPHTKILRQPVTKVRTTAMLGPTDGVQAMSTVPVAPAPVAPAPVAPAPVAPAPVAPAPVAPAPVAPAPVAEVPAPAVQAPTASDVLTSGTAAVANTGVVGPSVESSPVEAAPADVVVAGDAPAPAPVPAKASKKVLGMPVWLLAVVVLALLGAGVYVYRRHR